MASIQFDWSEVHRLGAELSGAEDRAMPKVIATTRRAAFNIKRNARATIQGQITGTYLPHYPWAISYETTVSRGEIDAEIGPRADKPQGGMGPGVEFGSSNTRPHPHMIPAFEEELPTWMEWLADATFESVLP